MLEDFFYFGNTNQSGDMPYFAMIWQKKLQID